MTIKYIREQISLENDRIIEKELERRRLQLKAALFRKSQLLNYLLAAITAEISGLFVQPITINEKDSVNNILRTFYKRLQKLEEELETEMSELGLSNPNSVSILYGKDEFLNKNNIKYYEEKGYRKIKNIEKSITQVKQDLKKAISGYNSEKSVKMAITIALSVTQENELIEFRKTVERKRSEYRNQISRGYKAIRALKRDEKDLREARKNRKYEIFQEESEEEDSEEENNNAMLLGSISEKKTEEEVMSKLG